MHSYLQSILPRLQRYSKQLNDEANFVEIPWAYLDEDGVKVTYLFRRNNELLVTKKGEVATGRWEYLPSMQSLLIEYVGKRRMYNQGFLDKAVLLLRKEGTEDFLALANMGLLPNLDIVRYIKSKAEQTSNEPSGSKKRFNPKELPYYPVSLSNGMNIHVWKTGKVADTIYIHGAKVTYTDGREVPTGIYKIKGGGVLEIEDGRVGRFQVTSINVYLLSLILIVMIFLFIALEFPQKTRQVA